jgi:bifunctional non-homologous end joining protein LigD
MATIIPTISALELQQINRPFDGPDWIFEIKYDGFRSLARIESGVCRLISPNDNAFKRFSDLAKAIPGDITADDAVLDGEIVVLDSNGQSLFYELMRSRAVPIFAAFDLLWLNGTDLRDQPLLERKRRLRRIVRKRAKRMLYVDHIKQNGKAMFAEVCKRDMEGIVAKFAISRYKSVHRRSPWIKIKNAKYTQKEGCGEMFNRHR